MTSEEYFDLIEDASSGVIGRATRKECHGNPALLHRSIRVLILHPDGKRMLLQKRALSKDVFPGRWDMAVGGHVDSGETPLCAARREMAEELGLDSNLPLQEVYTIKVRNSFESENVSAYSAISGGPFRIREEELSEVRFFTREELTLLKETAPDLLTPLLIRELDKILSSGMLLAVQNNE